MLSFFHKDLKIFATIFVCAATYLTTRLNSMSVERCGKPITHIYFFQEEWHDSHNNYRSVYRNDLRK